MQAHADTARQHQHHPAQDCGLGWVAHREGRVQTTKLEGLVQRADAAAGHSEQQLVAGKNARAHGYG